MSPLADFAMEVTEVAGEITGPIAWSRASLREGDGHFALPRACLRELEAVAASLARDPLPVLALDPAEFELSACRAFMAGVGAELRDGVGFALIDRLPIDRWGPDIAVGLYWLLGAILSRPVAQKWDGTMVYDVEDTGRPPGNGVRPDKTNAEQNFHTDNSYNLCPPDYVCLLCICPAAEGGISRIVSFATAHNRMRERHPELLPRLYRPFVFDRQREHAPGDPLTLSHPLFEAGPAGPTARLSRFQVLNGHKLAGVPLDSEGAAALEAFEEILNDPGLWKDFAFQPGQIQIVDNRRLGHKRTGFRDDPAHPRRLVRLWLRRGGRRSYHG